MPGGISDITEKARRPMRIALGLTFSNVATYSATAASSAARSSTTRLTKPSAYASSAPIGSR